MEAEEGRVAVAVAVAAHVSNDPRGGDEDPWLALFSTALLASRF